MSVSKAFSLPRWPQGGSTTMNKFLSSCHSLNSKPTKKKNRLPLINVSSVKSSWNAVKLKDVTNFESYWNLKYTLNPILQVKQKCKNKTKQLGRCLSCKEFCSWAFGSVLFLSVLFMSGDIFWNEGISPLRQESTFFFFFKGLFSNDGAASSFHLWCFLTSVESGRDVRRARGMMAGASPSTPRLLNSNSLGVLSFVYCLSVRVAAWLYCSLHETQAEWQARGALPPPVSRTCGRTALWARSGHPSSWPS